MPQDDPAALFADAERAELERVVEALARSPRLARLLQYMGEKFFSGEVDQLNEYNIATDVLGRSKTVFKAGEDAIARVETHRLRKRLAAFYEAEGRDHSIQVTLPSGSYVPVFIHKTPGTPSQALPEIAPQPQSESGREETRSSGWITRAGKYWVIAASLVVVVVGAYLYHRAALGRGAVASSTNVKPATEPSAAPAPVPLQADSSVPIRLLAGYSGPPRTDSAGRVWYPDQHFSGGGGYRRTPVFIARASDQFLFENSRNGDFIYGIPLKAGTYELHLFFSTASRTIESSSFNVSINGQFALVGFDINADALGENIADERIFRDVSPDKDGFLWIGFSGASGAPTLSALEVLSGLPGKQLPIRLVMQSTPFTDRKGQFWHPDNYFMHGRLATQTHPLLENPDPDLFGGERYGHFTYTLPVDTRGKYTLVLHFAELYFGSGASGNGGTGSRVFKVMCNGETLLDNFDIFKEAGNLHEVTKTFRHLKPSPQGKLNLTFEPIANNATISGIEVLDESQ
jgi:hypothetical protein